MSEKTPLKDRAAMAVASAHRKLDASKPQGTKLRKVHPPQVAVNTWLMGYEAGRRSTRNP